MSRFQWLLALHVSGAFLFIGGAVVAGALNVAAQRAKKPSEVATFLGLTRYAVPVIGVGSVMTLGFGLWLVHCAGFGYGQAWIVAAVVLWVLSGAMGGAGGKRDRATRELAERLAAETDAPSAELTARLRDPIALVLSYGSGVAVLVILALMFWKPGQ